MPEEKQIQTSFRLHEEDHRDLNFLAARERETIQELVSAALNKVFPRLAPPQKKQSKHCMERALSG